MSGMGCGWWRHGWSRWAAEPVFNGNVHYDARECAKCGRRQRRSA